MPTPVSTTKTWHFGLFEVDASRVELRRNGTAIKLREQSFLVLIQFLEHAGEIVTREQLRQTLWPSDTFVDFDHSLSTAVMKLREALGDSTGMPVYIETIPKHGYRFVAKVTTVEQNPAIAQSTPGASQTSLTAAQQLAANRRRQERLWLLVAGVAAVLLVSSTVWIATRQRSEPAPPAMVRFQVPAPGSLNFSPWDMPAVSPDGQRIAFTAHNRLFVRSLNAATAIEIPTSGSLVSTPFWSPDSQQIAFSYWGHQGLQRVALSGGTPVTICSDCNAWLGGTWSRDGVILSATRTSLFRVSAAGGIAKRLPLAQGEAAQRWPEFLPDGKHYLYLSVGKAPYQPGIYVASLDSTDRKFLVASEVGAAYLQSGRLLFTRGGMLMSQPFDLHSLKLSGEPQPVAEAHSPVSYFATSPTGVVAWRQSPNSSQLLLQWFDRGGKKLGVIGWVADYSSPELSPDESKLAVCIRDPQTKTRDIWIFDLRNGGKMRLTFNPADDCGPAWSPDGTRIAFTSDRSGRRNIYWKSADGSNPEELLVGGKDGQNNMEDWSRDGKYLSYDYYSDHAILRVLPLADGRKPITYLDTGFNASQSRFSPNGRWVAYGSTESGSSQIYVQGFSPDPLQPHGKWQISPMEGQMPRWRSDGKELYFLSGNSGNSFVAVEVKTDGSTFTAGASKLLFDAPTSSAGGNSIYAVTSDGQRFLVLEPADETLLSAPIEVLVNWRWSTDI